MSKYMVYLTIMVPMAASIEVDADNEDEAHAKAKKAVIESRDYEPIDFDGNNIDIIETDITIDEVEITK